MSSPLIYHSSIDLPQPWWSHGRPLHQHTTSSDRRSMVHMLSTEVSMLGVPRRSIACSALVQEMEHLIDIHDA